MIGNVGVDCVFDGVGKTTFDASLKCLKLQGELLSFGNASGKVEPIDIMKLVPNQIKLSRPSLFQLVKTRDTFKALAGELMGLLEAKILEVEVCGVYLLENAGEGHGDLQDKKTTGKSIINCLE